MRDIQKLVRSLGIGGNYQGYRYLLYALSLCLQNEDYLLSVSKLLYPEIAHTYQTSASSVERNLRTVVSVCWERETVPYWNPSLFVLSPRNQPSANFWTYSLNT